MYVKDDLKKLYSQPNPPIVLPPIASKVSYLIGFLEILRTMVIFEDPFIRTYLENHGSWGAISGDHPTPTLNP
jgi:hypothetical protein